MECTVNLKETEKFIKSDKFIQFLLNNTTDIGTVVFIIQTLMDKIEEIEKKDNNMGDL